MNEEQPRSGAPDPLGLLTARQREITEALARRNPELGRWFSSAAILTDTRAPAAWPEMAAHMCRDMMSRLPEYFAVPTSKRPSYDQSVANLFKALGGALDDPELRELSLKGKALRAMRGLAKQYGKGAARQPPSAFFEAAGRTGSPQAHHQAWLDAAWIDVQRGFVGVAHLQSIDQQPSDPETLLSLFERLEVLLAGQITSTFWTLDEQLKQIAAITEPTQRDLQGALALARGEAFDGFLDLLDSPAWLPLMRTAGLFDTPPATVELEQGYRSTPWASSGYLVRVADRVPDEVAEVLLTLPPTQNARVITDMVEAALRMPVEGAAAIAEKVKPLLGGPFRMFESLPASQLAAKLISEDRVEDGLALTATLFAAQPFAAVEAGLWTQVGFRHGFDDDYSFAEGLAVVGDAAAVHAPVQGLQTLAGTLAGILEREAAVRGQDGSERDSGSWRRAIEDHSQNFHENEPCNALVAAIRDLTVDAIQRDPSLGTDLLSILQSQTHGIFTRVALHVLRISDFPGVDELRRALLLDRGIFDSRGLHHELFLLQNERFGALSPEDQREVLAWIDAGPPNLDRWRAGHEAFYGRPPTDAEVRRDIDGWRQQRLRAIEPALDDDRRMQLERLNAEHGVYVHPDFTSYVEAGFVSADPPFAAEELGAKTPDELLELFVTWQPDGDGLAARHDGLAMAVEQAARDDPEHWSTIAPQLTVAPPRYRQFLLSGFSSAVALGTAFELDGVLDLATAHIADAPPSVADDETRRDGRRAIADLLHWLIVAQPEAARRHAERVWALIRQLASDDESPLTGSGPEQQWAAAQQAWSPQERELPLLSVRSLAYTAAVCFAELRLGDAYDVRDLLSVSLDPAQNSSLEVRSALAAALPTLLRTDADWIEGLAGPMLTSPPEELIDVAWAAVLDETPTNLDVVRALLRAGVYEQGIERVAGQERFSQQRREHLGKQLLGAVVYTGDVAAGPLEQWFAVEEPEIRARAVEIVGAGIGADEVRPADDTALVGLWRTRLVLEGDDAELAAYPSWVPAIKDRRVGAELVVETLKQTAGAIRGARQVIGWANEAAADAPLQVIEMIGLIAAGPNRTQIAWSEPRLRQVILTLDSSSDQDVAAALGQLLETLAERGFGDFRPDATS
jgi:hypothetical protein